MKIMFLKNSDVKWSYVSGYLTLSDAELRLCAICCTDKAVNCIIDSFTIAESHQQQRGSERKLALLYSETSIIICCNV